MFNITNSFDHPTRPGHIIFRFYEKEKAALFKSLLDKDSIWYEADVDKEPHKTTYLFGIKNTDLKAVNHKNYLVNAQFRKRIIPNPIFRWALIDRHFLYYSPRYN